MSTMTLTAPLIRPRRATSAPVRVQRAFVGTAPVRARPARPAAAAAGRPRSAPPVTPVKGARPAVPTPSTVRPIAARRSTQPGLRLTARGRVVVLGLLLVAGLVVTLATGTVSMVGSVSTASPASYVTVEAGDTLWSIAGDVAPRSDRRDTVAQLVELNALSDAVVQVGQQIAVPAGD